jgi:geranylgeranyl reductase family protein
MEHFDAIVVGAGPAGSTAAYRLAREGARVLLLDKACFPRDKPCGGGLSVRAMRQLPVDPEPVVEHVVDRMEFSFRGHGCFVRGGRQPLAHMTQRSRLDHFLIEQAVAAGADFRDGVKVSEVSEHGARVDGTWIASELLIGADGANGVTARSLGLGGSYVYGVGLEGNLAHGVVDPGRWRGVAAIELGTVPGGYGWILPKGDHVNVGVGGWETEGPMVRKHLEELCERRGFDYSRIEGLRGYRLPARQPNMGLARGRALLVGDAGGLVDPLWGDGMYAAFVSSRLAAEAAMNLLTGRAACLEPYARAVNSELGRMIAFAWDAKAGLDRFPRLAVGAMLSAPGWRVLEKMLRGEIREPGAERGVAGIAVRAFEGWGRRTGWPGTPYRAEARTGHRFGTSNLVGAVAG